MTSPDELQSLKGMHDALPPDAGRLRALVDGVEVLTVEDLHFAGRRGPVGLFVGDGSRGYFRELRVRPA